MGKINKKEIKEVVDNLYQARKNSEVDFKLFATDLLAYLVRKAKIEAVEEIQKEFDNLNLENEQAKSNEVKTD